MIRVTEILTDGKPPIGPRPKKEKKVVEAPADGDEALVKAKAAPKKAAPRRKPRHRPRRRPRRSRKLNKAQARIRLAENKNDLSGLVGLGKASRPPRSPLRSDVSDKS